MPRFPAACERHARHRTEALSPGWKAHKGTGWGYCTHLRAYGLNFDFGLANSLLALAPASALEFGCGLGLYTSWLHRVGGAEPCVGIEPMPMPSSVFRAGAVWPRQIEADLLNATGDTQACMTALGAFDLVYSMEVAEHIPRSKHAALADMLVRHTRHFLVFSAGRPGQAGRAHIANRPASEWITEFTSRGLVHLPMTTKRFRGAARNIELRHNLNVFATASAPRGRTLDGGDEALWGASVAPPRADWVMWTAPECRAPVSRNTEHKGDKCNATHGVAGRHPVNVTRHGATVALPGGRLRALRLPPDDGDADAPTEHGQQPPQGGREVLWYPRLRLRLGELAMWPGLVAQAADECWGYLRPLPAAP